ncbi:oxidoreductase [Deinococcus ruber]|uniref:3-oxoacyl-ACP reductase n=1 Tax=Deinococcus ruber TaxID=1848197 RepID=A0A918KX95_9DEIO|nr:oxidoreductase [Deinococcus ruber]GGR38776.1 3-oxoacyl-ACP reductase [Deinococcus ruber]
MELELQGKVAVVTGASKGIGLAVTRALVREGVKVVAAARDTTLELNELVTQGQVLSVQLDLGTPDGPTRLVAQALEAYGTLDILINNVGAVRPRTGGFLTLTDDEWLWGLNINFLSAVRTTRAALPALIAQGTSTIVNTCSVNAILPDPLVIEYSAAKAALLNFSKALSKEVGRLGVRVNTVSPGPVSTDLWLGQDGVAATVSRASGRTAEEVARQATSGTATGRFTRPEEVANLIVLLASRVVGNVTGADFMIDGGLVQTI